MFSMTDYSRFPHIRVEELDNEPVRGIRGRLKMLLSIIKCSPESPRSKGKSRIFQQLEVSANQGQDLRTLPGKTEQLQHTAKRRPILQKTKTVSTGTLSTAIR
jgi:hypothetical protein